VTCKLTFPRAPLVLALLVALATSPALAQNPKKPPKDLDPDPVVVDPDPVVVTPVQYAVRTVPVVGLNYSFDTNDYGSALCNFATDQVLPPLATQASETVGVVDIHSGQVTYIDPLLTAPTIWTELPEGVDDVSVGAIKINNFGTILVMATPFIDGEGQQYPHTYLLKPVQVATPDGGTELRYQPTNLGFGNAHFLNDLDWIVGEDPIGQFIRIADGTKIYLNKIGLPNRPGEMFDLTHSGLFNGQTSTNDPNPKKYIFDVLTRSVTYYDGVDCKDWPGRSMNDHGVIAGRHTVTFEYKNRGKTETGYRDVPAILDTTTGLLQVFDVSGNTRVVDGIVYINHQRKNGESTILSYYPKDAQRDLWLKLPGAAGFHLYDAMNSVEKQEWTAIGYGDRINWWEGPTDFVRILTPRNEDYSVDNNKAPTITGVIWSGGPGYPGFWVCEPVVATP
jgi:hypothetical protein